MHDDHTCIAQASCQIENKFFLNITGGTLNKTFFLPHVQTFLYKHYFQTIRIIKARKIALRNIKNSFLWPIKIEMLALHAQSMCILQCLLVVIFHFFFLFVNWIYWIYSFLNRIWDNNWGFLKNNLNLLLYLFFLPPSQES